MSIANEFIDTIRKLPADENGWIAVDIPRIARSINAQPASTANAVRDLKDKNIIELRMKHARKIEAVRLLYSASNGQSMKDIVSTVLGNYADKRGLVRVDTRTIARRVGLSDHDLTKILFDMRKENKISFRKSGSGETLRLRNIKVLNNGVVKEPEPPAPEPPKAPEQTPYLFRAEKFPLILRLLSRQKNIEVAASHLEAAGLDDEAIALMEKVDSISPFEKEVLSLVTSLGWEK